VFKWLAHSEIHEGAVCKWCVAFAPDVVSRSAKALGMLVKITKMGKKRNKIISLIKHVNTRVRSQGGSMGAIAPPPNSKSSTKNFQSSQAFNVYDTEILQSKSPISIPTVLHNLVEPDQSTMVHQLSMFNQM